MRDVHQTASVRGRLQHRPSDPRRAGRRNLSQHVVEDVLEQIRNGRLKVGDRLPTERGMMERYGIGRSAVREAVQSLVAMGLLDVRPGRGATLVGLDSDHVLDSTVLFALLDRGEIDDLLDLRQLIEVEAAARAAHDPKPDVVANLAELLGRFQIAVAGHTPAFGADLDFHRAIVDATGNAVFSRTLDAMADLLSTIREQTEHVPGTLQLALVQHQAIYDAIAAGKPDAARAAAVAHIVSARAAAEEAKRLADAASPHVPSAALSPA